MEGTPASRKRAEVERTTILALESGFRCGVASYRGRRVSGSDEPGGENDGYRARRAARLLPRFIASAATRFHLSSSG